jgi:alpha-glucosidase
VKGLENNKWCECITPRHNVTLPFTRMVPGPMDYTPGAMVNAHKKNFSVSWDRPMSMTTRVQQMAMYVVYESPLQMLADNPSNYLRNAECLAFMAHVPTTWDETHALAGEVGEYVAVARRKGDKWYVGAMNGGKARDLTLDLSFLPEGTWQVTLFEDGVNAPRYAQDYRKRVITLSGRSMKIHMDTGGGWAGVFEKK